MQDKNPSTQWCTELDPNVSGLLPISVRFARSPRVQEKPPDLGLTDAAAVGKEDLVMDTHCLGLSLLNVALESGGDEIARSDELIAVIQDDICKSLLHNSRTASLSVLSLTLRAIFNLFLHFKRHLKVQLEIFFTSVHLKIAGCGTASYEQRELALESLVEFCREPSLMLELYENYDCDVRCTNLFETLVKFLVTHAVPEEARGNFTSLHKLAFSGLLSILHALALRCASHKHFHEQLDLEPTTPPSGETELQRKKDQKRRLTIAARTFNSEPSKSTGALQGLGLLSNPLTPESMAEFLRHTPGLDMNIVGEFLGKRHDFNGQVRKAFLDTFPFAGLGLVEALRLFLATFRLPGEAQCIERLMESFAEAYFRSQPVADGAGAASEEKPQNPLAVTRWVPRERSEEADRDARDAGRAGGPEDGAGEERVEPTRVPMVGAPGEDERGGSVVKAKGSDTIFILAFSIIMLNTDLHNPGVKKKMCLEEFVRVELGSVAESSQPPHGDVTTGDLPQYFLSDIFEAESAIALRSSSAPYVRSAGPIGVDVSSSAQ
ncbi:ARF guanine-nucleotide exchange factor GNOM (Pattern formation protein EMB30) (Protein EMBRYO DEFECTIVE 30) (Protein MIZU-KUSSEI2) (Protein VASCULAR NETWORK 7) [Durusdinium trenchii]|uniref:ARF guanine-nucleotide exchange factor GNOM (Pattern formation protein EMB30) (Protein EMBRYO DEFECTIVE 30) (Protein MIZU-KUSSEI2) (Protein VASCULAR NETWORK 7) n=1 Tax=Durusdinium trenchii TaxID=1381693 RepID=A0ABP0HGM1_9DINO